MNFTHISIIPLIGGLSLATSNILKSPPKAIFSYKCFYNNDKLYLDYLKQNNLNIPYYQLDTSEWLQNIDKYIYSNIDIVSGLPPCAGLSSCSQLKPGARQTSPVNEHMYNAANFILEYIQPKAYVFENSPNLYSNVGIPVRQNLIDIANKFGYSVTFYKTDTLLHGIPQHRPRAYCIFYKGKYAPILNYCNIAYPTLEEFLKQLPKDSTLQDVYQTKEPFIKDFEIYKFFKYKYGENWRQETLKNVKHYTSYDYLRKMNLMYEFKDFLTLLENKGEEVSPIVKREINHVITKTEQNKNFRLSHRVIGLHENYTYAVYGESMERICHPVEDRKMNIREYLHLMSMPHDFQIENPRDYVKLSQNVPIKTSEFIISEIVEVLKGNRNFSSENILMQDNTKAEKIKTKKLF